MKLLREDKMYNDALALINDEKERQRVINLTEESVKHWANALSAMQEAIAKDDALREELRKELGLEP